MVALINHTNTIDRSVGQAAARESQLLPFVRTRLTDLQRATLVDALSAASERASDHRGRGLADPVALGGTLLACSLDTGKSIAAITELLPTILQPVTLGEGPLPAEPCLCRTGSGEFGWHFPAKALRPAAEDITVEDPANTKKRDFGWVWLPVTELTNSLLAASSEALSGICGHAEAEMGVQHALAAFNRWCADHFGFRCSTQLLNKIRKDLAHRLANGVGSDMSLAQLVTGELEWNAAVRSSYTSITRGELAKRYISTLSELDPPAVFSNSAASAVPAPELRVGPADSLANDRLALGNISPAAKPEITPHADERLAHYHNQLTLQTWLATSVAIGARESRQSLINPAAILPGNLVLIGDKAAKGAPKSSMENIRGRAEIESKAQEQADSPDAPDSPMTRIGVLPDHVAERIRAYGVHIEQLANSLAPGSTEYATFHRWFSDLAGAARWEPIFLLGKYRPSTKRNTYRFVRLTKLSLNSPPEELEQLINAVRGNQWRHLLRSRLLHHVPGEMIDAVMGHWFFADEPWWNGAALDPVECWSRMGAAQDVLMHKNDWRPPVLPAGLPGYVSPPLLAAVGSRSGYTPAPPREPSLSPRGDLHRVFDAEAFGQSRIAFELEREHLARLEQFPRIPAPLHLGQLLMSAILWSGLLDPEAWQPWLVAVAKVAETQGSIDHVALCYQSAANSVWAGYNYSRTVYHDPLTMHLLKAWRGRLKGMPKSWKPDPLLIIRDWLKSSPALREAEREILDHFHNSLELRARLRLPGCVVDYATGRVPSPSVVWSHGKPANVKRPWQPVLNEAPKPDRQYNNFDKSDGTGNFAEVVRQMSDLLKKSPVYIDRYQLRACLRDKLRQVFGEELDRVDRLTAHRHGLELVLARLLYEMASTPARRGKHPLYSDRQREVDDLAQMARMMGRLPSSVMLNLSSEEKAALGDNLRCLFKITGVWTELSGPDPQCLAAITDKIVLQWTAKVPLSKDTKEQERFKRVLRSALLDIAWPSDVDGRIWGDHKPQDTRFRPARDSYDLVSHAQFIELLKLLGNPVPDTTQSQNAARAKRRSDICRIAAILMFRAGVRPLELASLQLSDLSIRCNQHGVVTFAELLITANKVHIQKTRLSRRKIPLDALLEPEELALLRSWQSLRLIETGGRTARHFLFDLAPTDQSNGQYGRMLKAQWILGPVAAALAAVQGQQPTKRTNANAYANYCYRLRHTAASTLLATLLLPRDADISQGARWLPGLVPELINLPKRERLAKRLLGPGRAGRSSLHAVARILGHSDLVSLRATYTHLMDWSLAVSCSRPGVQPPLPRMVLAALQDQANPPSPVTIRKAARNQHHRISLLDPANADADFVMVLPQYRRARPGRQSSAVDSLTDHGYLRYPKEDRAPPRDRPSRVALALWSVPERHDLADLVIRSYKNGLDLAGITRRFGVDRSEARRLLRNWHLLTAMRAQPRASGMGRSAALFGPLASRRWYSLQALPLQDRGRHPFCQSFGAYSRALSSCVTANSLGGPVRAVIGQALRIFLTRRKPSEHFQPVLKMEKHHDRDRWLKTFRTEVEQHAGAGVIFNDRWPGIWLCPHDLSGSGAQKSSAALSQEVSGLAAGEPPESKWATYALLLFVADKYHDVRPFLQALHLHWATIRTLSQLFGRQHDPAKKNKKLVLWIPKRLWGKLGRAANDTYQRAYAKRASGLVEQLGEASFLFRLMSVRGDVVAGIITRAEARSGGERYVLKALSWRPRRYDAYRPFTLEIDGNAFKLHQEPCGVLTVETTEAGQRSAVFATALEGAFARPVAPQSLPLAWQFSGKWAEKIEARLFAAGGIEHMCGVRED